MKIQIDTQAKVIRIEDSVNLGELIETLEKLLPGEWKSYKLETQATINNWTNPIIIDRWPYEPYYPKPWWQEPTIICDTETVSFGTDPNMSIYNLDILCQ